MTTTNYGAGVALPIDSVQYAAKDTRDALSMAMLPRSGAPLGGRSGIRPGAEPALSIDSSGNWTVSPFAAYVDPRTAANPGPYWVAFQTQVTGTANPADATYERIDRLDIQVPDDPPGTAPKNAVLVYSPGTPSAQPVAPAAPSRSTPLATMTVPAVGGSAPSIVAAYQYTTALGGIVPCLSTSDRPTAQYRGLYLDDPTLGLMRWDGSKWTTAIHGDTGWEAAGIVTAASGGTITGQSAKLRGDKVQIYVSGTLPSNQAGNSSGDYTNVTVGTIASAWRPTHGVGLGSANVGANFTFYLDSSGALQVVSGPPAGFSKGDPFSVSGFYYID